MVKKTVLITLVLLIFSLACFVLVEAATTPPPPPPCESDGCNGTVASSLCQPDCTGAEDPDCNPSGCCGDSEIQSPNGDSKQEKCDTGVVKKYCENDENIECEDDSPCGTYCLARMKGFCDDDPNSSEGCWRDSDCTNDKCVFSCTPECGARLLGWAWSDNFGWLSLNSDNCLTRYLATDLLEEYPPSKICSPTSFPYYVQATADNEIKGWAWSDNIGYICFGNSCSGSPPVGPLQAILDFDDPQSPQVIGWAQAVNLPDNNWFSLNCASDSSCASSDYQVRLIQSEFNGTCSGTPAKKCNPIDECGAYCCSEGEGSCQAESRLTLSGWAWNGNGSGSGLGWVNFNPPISEIPPWLQTRYGDIYAGEGLTGEQPPGYSATYRILSSGAIERFLSAQGTDWWVSPNFGRINFPTPETRYSNILGQLDVDGLICIFSGGSNVCTNRYGNQVVNLNNLPLASSQLLDGDIYYYDGQLDDGQLDIDKLILKAGPEQLLLMVIWLLIRISPMISQTL